MSFLDMGMLEIVVILIVALLIFGPGKIPEIGRQLGRGLRAFRRVTTDLTKEFTKALDAEEKAASSKAKSGDKLDKTLDKIEKGAKSLDKFLGEQDKKDG